MDHTGRLVSFFLLDRSADLLHDVRFVSLYRKDAMQRDAGEQHYTQQSTRQYCIYIVSKRVRRVARFSALPCRAHLLVRPNGEYNIPFDCPLSGSNDCSVIVVYIRYPRVYKKYVILSILLEYGFMFFFLICKMITVAVQCMILFPRISASTGNLFLESTQ